MNAQWVASINIINQWADQWGAAIWRACWQGSIAILFVWGVSRVLPQMSPRVRCWLWRLAYVKLLMVLLWTSPLEIPLLHSSRMLEPLSASIQKSSQKPAIYPTSHLPHSQVNETGGPAYSVVMKSSLTPVSALMILWLLGGIVVGAQIVWEWRSVCLRRCAAPLDVGRHAALAADFEGLRRRSGVGRPIALLVTNASDRPHVFGVIHPAIVLPVELLAESERNGLLAVLAHEIAHVKRKDLFWNWLPAVTHMLFFFCPLIWLANREWHLAQEIACDEMAVLNTRTDAAEYGEMLVRMVTTPRHVSRSGVTTLGIIETPQTLKRRLIAMRFIHPISRRKLALAGGTCVALGIFGIVPWQVVAQEARANRILFVSNRLNAQRFRIFAMNPDGSHVTQLTHGPLPESDVVVTPDGKTVIRPAAAHRDAMELDPVWSPDGKRIAFTLAVSEKPEPESRVKMNLYVMNADGSDCKEVTHFAYGLEAVSPVWSPEGTRIAFTLQSRNDSAPGGIDTTVCATDLTGFWTVAEGMWPSWSHDGKNILYTAFADRTGLTTCLYEANAYGTLDGKRNKLLDNVLQGALSPDGKRLAYIAMSNEPNGDKISNIVVSNADGSQPKPLTSLNDRGPVGIQWASDGRHIYFTRPTKSSAAQATIYQIYAMEADGSHVQALTKGDALDCLGADSGLFLTSTWLNRITTLK